MGKMKNVGLLLTGIALGIGLTGPMAQAAETWLQAHPSSQSFYVDGHKVDLEAYEINGYNYIKLRDIGQAMGFHVSYDPIGNAALILTEEPYSNESTLVSSPVADYAAQVDPSIFTGVLTEVVYNGIRDSMAHREAILAGTYDPVPLKGVTSLDELAGLSPTIGIWPSYQFKRNDADEVVCRPRYTPAWQAAADHCQPFIDSLDGLSDREKIWQMDFYVCDRMTYSLQSADVGEILSQDSAVPSYCMNYAYCFKFLCDMAGVPCVLVRSSTHMWNEVYVEGRWWSVDVTDDDAGDEVEIRRHLPILHPLEEYQRATYRDSAPQVTVFAKELLVPGSSA